MKYLYLSCCTVAAIFVFGSLWIGWRPNSPRFGFKRNAEVQASAREVESLCSQAQLIAKGVKAGDEDQCEGLEKKLQESYGKPVAATIAHACVDKRVVVEQDLLFFPEKSLCNRRDLPAVCSKLCERWRSGNARRR